jgi:hypothetical protein
VPEYRSKQARECHVAVCARPEGRTVKTVKKEKRSDVQHMRLRVWPQWQRAARRHSVKGRSEQTQGSQAPVCCGHRMIFETGSGAKRLAGCVGGPRAQPRQPQQSVRMESVAALRPSIRRHHGCSNWLRWTPTRNRGSAGARSARRGRRRTGQQRVGHQRPHRTCSRCAVLPKRARAGLFYGDLRPRAASTRRNKKIGRLRQQHDFLRLPLLLLTTHPPTLSTLRSRSVRHRRHPPVTQPLPVRSCLHLLPDRLTCRRPPLSACFSANRDPACSARRLSRPR